MLKALFKQRNPCSNHEIHVPFEHGFDIIGQCGAMSLFHRNKIAKVDKAWWFSKSFYAIKVIFKDFK